LASLRWQGGLATQIFFSSLFYLAPFFVW
jgi:hypothetical protein